MHRCTCACAWRAWPCGTVLLALGGFENCAWFCGLVRLAVVFGDPITQSSVPPTVVKLPGRHLCATAHADICTRTHNAHTYLLQLFSSHACLQPLPLLSLKLHGLGPSSSAPSSPSGMSPSRRPGTAAAAAAVAAGAGVVAGGSAAATPLAASGRAGSLPWQQAASPGAAGAASGARSGSLEVPKTPGARAAGGHGGWGG